MRIQETRFKGFTPDFEEGPLIQVINPHLRDVQDNGAYWSAWKKAKRKWFWLFYPFGPNKPLFPVKHRYDGVEYRVSEKFNDFSKDDLDEFIDSVTSTHWSKHAVTHADRWFDIGFILGVTSITIITVVLAFIIGVFT